MKGFNKNTKFSLYLAYTQESCLVYVQEYVLLSGPRTYI